MKKNKNKKMPIIAITALAIIGIVGGTIAYFTSESVFPNVFKTKKIEAEFTEEFTSPDPNDPNAPEWKPGSKVDKVVEIKNTSDIPLAARVSYTEEWVAADGTKLPNTIEVEGAQERVVNIHMPEEANWIKDGTADNIKGQPVNTWYYYNKVIKKNETAKFMDYVTFNPKVDIEYDEEITYTYTDNTTSTGPTPEEGKTVKKTTKKYTSKDNGYAGATYTLTITIQTVQYDAYESHWGVSKDTVNIAEA